jgi:hypothetical protein
MSKNSLEVKQMVHRLMTEHEKVEIYMKFLELEKAGKKRGGICD